MVKKWLLQFNSQKIKAVFFSLKNVEQFPKLFLGDCTLEYVFGSIVIFQFRMVRSH